MMEFVDCSDVEFKIALNKDEMAMAGIKGVGDVIDVTYIDLNDLSGGDYGNGTFSEIYFTLSSSPDNSIERGVLSRSEETKNGIDFFINKIAIRGSYFFESLKYGFSVSSKEISRDDYLHILSIGYWHFFTGEPRILPSLEGFSVNRRAGYESCHKALAKEIGDCYTYFLVEKTNRNIIKIGKSIQPSKRLIDINIRKSSKGLEFEIAEIVAGDIEGMALLLARRKKTWKPIPELGTEYFDIGKVTSKNNISEFASASVSYLLDMRR